MRQFALTIGLMLALQHSTFIIHIQRNSLFWCLQWDLWSRVMEEWRYRARHPTSIGVDWG